MNAIAAALSVAAAVSTGQAEAQPMAAPRPLPPAASAAEEEQLWLEVQLDEQPLTDSLDAVRGPDGRAYLPLGALARLLDLAVTVSAADRRAEGWVVREDRRVSLDLARGILGVAGQETPVAPAEALVRNDEIWVTAELLGRILPITARLDAASQTLAIRARERLPSQERNARAGARARLGAEDAAPSDVRRVDTPYLPFTWPSVDFSLDTGLSNRAPQESVRYDLRLGGDLAWAGFQLFAGSDGGGALSSVRVLLERKDPEGRTAGPFGATRTALGDVFTPALALGVRSVEGRGLVSTSAPIEQVGAFTRVAFRGELPLGFEVELYVNDVLRGSQATPINGRYEFLDVSLSYGLNIVRLVFYGPRGERREQVRRINYGSEQLAAGATQFRFGVVQQNTPVIDVGRRDPLFTANPGRGDLRFVGELHYGLTAAMTLVSGVSYYTPPTGGSRGLATAGLRTTFRGFALQADAAADSRGGLALATGVAGRAFGISWIARHAEYGGGFVDELQPRGAFDAVALRRSTDIFIDGQALLPGVGAIPLSFDAHRSERVNGDVVTLAEGRASLAVQTLFLSTFFAFEHDTASLDEGRLTGGADVTTLLRGDWQLRAGFAYDVAPDFRLSSAYLAVDRDIADRVALRFAVTHTIGPGEDTVFQAASIWRFNTFDLALTGGYSARDGDWRLGLQFAFGLLFDPSMGRYRAVRPGVAAGGAIAFESWVDRNGDGRRQPDEEAVPGLIVQGGPREAATDAQGRAVATGLGAGASARLNLVAESVADPYLSGGSGAVEIVPRPGRLAVVRAPLQPTGEAELRVRLRGPAGAETPLSAVRIQLTDASDAVVAEARSEYDGSVPLEGLRPGRYAVRLDPEQAGRLGLRVASASDIVVPAGGGYVGASDVVLERTS